MARGWESKSVEEQMDSFDAQRGNPRREQLSPEQLERQRQRDSLLLSRTRVIRDLEQSRNERHREILKQSLAHLEAKLAELG